VVTEEWQKNIKLVIDEFIQNVRNFEVELQYSRKFNKNNKLECASYSYDKLFFFLEESWALIGNIIPHLINTANTAQEQLQKIILLQKQMCNLAREILPHQQEK
jgi:hypothetical protein